jgi:hypothetical protein
VFEPRALSPKLEGERYAHPLPLFEPHPACPLGSPAFRRGTVCGGFFQTIDAKVVCSQLGLPTNAPTVRTPAFFGEGSLPIVMDGVACGGSESTLQNCSYIAQVGSSGGRKREGDQCCFQHRSPLATHLTPLPLPLPDACMQADVVCFHSEDISVSCPPPPDPATATVRLAGSPSKTEGRVEVLIDGEW